jgi:hypothetical protein
LTKLEEQFYDALPKVVSVKHPYQEVSRMKMRLAVIGALFGAATMMLASGEDQGKKEITVWSWFISSTMEKSIKAFEQKNPGLKVRYTYYNYSPQYITALKAGAASNSLPDIIGLQPGSLTQQYREQLASLNSYAAQEAGKQIPATAFSLHPKYERIRFFLLSGFGGRCKSEPSSRRNRYRLGF